MLKLLILTLAFFLGFAQAQAQTVAGTLGEFGRLRLLDVERTAARTLNASANAIQSQTTQYAFYLAKYAEYNALAAKTESLVKDEGAFTGSLATLTAARQELADIVAGKIKAPTADASGSSAVADSSAGLPSPYSRNFNSSPAKTATTATAATFNDATESEILNNFRPSATPTN